MPIDRRKLIVSVFAASAVLLDLPDISAQEPPWIILAGPDSGPAGRWGHTLVFDGWNNQLLIAGGRDERGTMPDTLWSFDLDSYTWTQLELDGPTPRWGSASTEALDGSGFYYFGGASDDQTFDDLWWFDFATSSWQPIESSGSTPPARSGSKGIIDPLGRFVLSHGRNGDTLLDDTWAFDPTTSNWTDLSPAPETRPMARSDHDLLVLPDYGLILLYGGCSDDIGPCPRGDLWSFDSSNGIWTDITPVAGPTPRAGSALARLGNTILLVGGFTELGPESDVWRGFFDGITIGWNELTLVNHGPMGIYRRSLHAMTAAGNDFFVFGGNGVEGALGDLWAFSLERFSESDHSIEPTAGDEYVDSNESESYEESE